VFDSDVQSALLFIISLTSTYHDLLSFQIVVSKFKEWKRQHFCGRPRATLSIATPLSTVVQATTPSTPVSRLLAKRNTNTDHVWSTEDGLYD